MFVFNKWLNYYGEIFAGSSVRGAWQSQKQA